MARKPGKKQKHDDKALNGNSTEWAHILPLKFITTYMSGNKKTSDNDLSQDESKTQVACLTQGEINALLLLH